MTKEQFHEHMKEKQEEEAQFYSTIDGRYDELIKVKSDVKKVQTNLIKLEEINDNFRESYSRKISSDCHIQN